MKNLLHEFFNLSSDSNIFLEATQQENMEKSFMSFIESKSGQNQILSIVDNMCVKSLSPVLFKNWEDVKSSLIKNRKL